jgi:predicted nucleic acid-binding protein
MTALLDTSVLVPYLTGEPRPLAARAARIIDGPERIAVPAVVIAETAFVLASVYRLPREALVDGLIALLQKRNLVVQDLAKGIAIQALLLCRPSARVSFADAMVWAAARSAGADVVYTFDERLPDDGIVLRRDRPIAG